MFVLWFAIFCADDVILDVSVGMPSQIETLGDHLLVIDANNNSLFHVRYDGKVIRRYHKPGAGPGETSAMKHVVVTQDAVIVLDPKQYKLVFLDHQLQFLRQQRIPSGIYGTFAVTPRGFAFCRILPGQDAVLHGYNQQMEHQWSSGNLWRPKGLEKDFSALITRNTSMVVSHGDTLYVANLFGLYIQAFDLDGQEVGRWDLPGLDPEELRSDSGFPVMGKALSVDAQGHVYLAVIKQGKDDSIPVRDAWYRLNPTTGSFDRAVENPRFSFLLPDGQFLRSYERDDEQVLLRPHGFAFKALR